jgi:integrase
MCIITKIVLSIDVIDQALNQAVANKFIRDNPATGCRLPKREKPEVKPLDKAQQTDFLKAIEGHRHELLYRIALFTGLREGEILGLTWDCIDFKKGVLTIKQQLRKDQRKGGAYYVSSTKNGKARKLIPAPYVMKLLKDQQQKMLEAKFKADDLWTDKVDLNGKEYDFVLGRKNNNRVQCGDRNAKATNCNGRFKTGGYQ